MLENGETTLATEPINPPTMDMLTDAEIIDKLEQMRSNRLVLVLEHQKVVRMKAKAKHETLIVKAGKLADKIAKAIDKVDAEIAKVETFRHQIQALRIQALDMDEEIGE